MEEENIDVTGEAETPEESSPEENEQVVDDVKEETTDVPVDEKGVPIKNRIAERGRKLRKELSTREAEEALTDQTQFQQELEENEAIKIVESIVEKKIKKALEPTIAKQFLVDHPDATEMIDDIIAVRKQHPELRDVEKLELAYLVAKAQRQDELIRQRVEEETKTVTEKKEQASQSAIEGAGKAKGATRSLVDQINSANSLEELEALGNQLK